MTVRDIRAATLDRFAIALSGLCLIHCLASAILIAAASAAGGALGDPIIHELGLAIAIALGAVALGRGIVVHRRVLPAAMGAIGLGMMAGALMLPHGAGETVWTVLGVVTLAAGHYLNRRAHLGH